MDEKNVSIEFVEFCEKNGIKKTIQRSVVFDIVHKNQMHPTVDEIYRQVKKILPMIKPESVYRILTDFQKAGLLEKLGINSAMRYDSNTKEHSHFICSNCGKIIDIPNIKFETPDFLKKASDIKVILTGVCKECKHQLAENADSFNVTVSR